MKTLTVPVPALILILAFIVVLIAAAGFLVFKRRTLPVPVAPAELDAAVARFLGAFQTVFEDDWAYSRELLEKDMSYAVEPSGTFLRPGSDFDKKNWGARTALLSSHAELVGLLKARGLAPLPPERDDYFVHSWPAG